MLGTLQSFITRDISINYNCLLLTHQSFTFPFLLFFPHSITLPRLLISAYGLLLALARKRPSGFTFEVGREVRKSAVDWFPSEARKTLATPLSPCSFLWDLALKFPPRKSVKDLPLNVAAFSSGLCVKCRLFGSLRLI